MNRPNAATAALLLFACLVLSACPGIDESARPPKEHGVAQHWADIRKTFASYKKAVMDGDGEAASHQVSSDTLDHYEEMRQLAVRAGPAQIREQSFINRFLITRMRVEMDHSALRKMDGREVFEFGISEGWTDDAGLAGQELGRINVDGDFANAEQTGGTPSSYDFHREDQRWKLDLLAIIESTNMVFKQLADQSGQSENQYLFTALESATGRRVSQSVWRRPSR